MLCFFRLLRSSLPFEPMALTTLDSLHSRLRTLKSKSEMERPTDAHQAESQKGNDVTHPHLHDSPHWFQTSSPFFISPKHDGVRMITFPPQLSSTCSKRCEINEAKTRKSRSGSTENPNFTATTCFSRYGRPIYGMFWIEKELALLRALCGDPLLVLDGELYIHQNVSDVRINSQTEESSSPAENDPPKKRSHQTQKGRKNGVPSIPPCEPQDAKRTPGRDAFKTGFLAVSALVHRLRGSGKTCLFRGGISPKPSISDGLKEVLQYVSTLPRYCLFDVVSFSPCQTLVGGPGDEKHAQTIEEGRQRESAANRQILSELRRILHLTLEAHKVADAEMLRCIPNVTPFSQRVRTLYFLTDLLSRGLSSPMLIEAFDLVNGIAEEESASGGGLGVKKRTRYDNSNSCGRRSYIQMIPYRLVRSLDEAEHSLLPRYVAQGYEGAVIRTPTNLYEFHEKRKGVLKHFIEPLLLEKSSNGKRARPRRRASAVNMSSPPSRRAASVHQDIVNTQAMVLLRTYAGDEVNNGHRRASRHGEIAENETHENNEADEPAARNPGEEDIDASSQQIARLALERSKNLSRRCETCVKLLPFRDKEYAVLRPLLKFPSTNPRTRPLVAIPLKEIESLEGLKEVTIKRNSGIKEKGASTHDPCSNDEGVVVFYGLKCLAENGRVFNVSIPKMSTEKQRALLQHLLEASRKRQGKKTLTGMYVTVKFASLTEHGIPRFGTVKAIRGGKGWFL
ncbi:unnamed protein product [Phytomonas sp. Hart1]|nr:unnamed protein product [Phytomonas sp. Hart1]|eukprot:CCW67693.1 unnamed protein product [Phytomonas sp. isolate Hart1]